MPQDVITVYWTSYGILQSSRSQYNNHRCLDVSHGSQLCSDDLATPRHLKARHGKTWQDSQSSNVRMSSPGAHRGSQGLRMSSAVQNQNQKRVRFDVQLIVGNLSRLRLWQDWNLVQRMLDEKRRETLKKRQLEQPWLPTDAVDAW